MKNKQPYFELIKCGACKGKGTWNSKTTCVYCNGSGKRKEFMPHPTHSMSKWRSEMLAPCGTPRFYSVRNCTNCGKEEWKHSAGHFLHGLGHPCTCKGKK